MLFSELSLHPRLLQNLDTAGYASPTPIQEQAIPHVLAGRDLVAVAQTGTGKTAAFALPILQRLMGVEAPKGKPIRVLVLSPTRELATQIGDGFRTYGAGSGLSGRVIFGGVGQNPQIDAVRRGVDVLIATPGRLLDLMGQRHIDFGQLEVLVLDEADRMLDMGFIHDVKRIIKAIPEKRQTLLFSATMPSDIEELAARILRDPVRVAVTPPSTTVERIEQAVYFVEKTQKRGLLLHLLEDPSARRVLVFTRTKHGANKVAETLQGRMGAAAIHGNKSQGARERALADFRSGKNRVLVATDIAARGIDIDDVTHVIQLDLPEVPEQYVHRIGRTARAGSSGVAWAFCSSDERGLLRDIERNIRQPVEVVKEHPFASNIAPPAARDVDHAPERAPARKSGGANRPRPAGARRPQGARQRRG